MWIWTYIPSVMYLCSTETVEINLLTIFLGGRICFILTAPLAFRLNYIPTPTDNLLHQFNLSSEWYCWSSSHCIIWYCTVAQSLSVNHKQHFANVGRYFKLLKKLSLVVLLKIKYRTTHWASGRNDEQT